MKSYEEVGDIRNPDYEKLLFDEVYSKYFCRIQPWPDSLLRSFQHLNTQVHNTIEGPNEYLITGNSKSWNRWVDLPNITILLMRFRDEDVWVEEGEMIIVPTKIEHQPVAQEEVHVMLFEPKSTFNTGNVVEERTKTNLEQI